MQLTLPRGEADPAAAEVDLTPGILEPAVGEADSAVAEADLVAREADSVTGEANSPTGWFGSGGGRFIESSAAHASAQGGEPTLPSRAGSPGKRARRGTTKRLALFCEARQQGFQTRPSVVELWCSHLFCSHNHIKVLENSTQTPLNFCVDLLPLLIFVPLLAISETFIFLQITISVDSSIIYVIRSLFHYIHGLWIFYHCKHWHCFCKKKNHGIVVL